MTAKKTVKIYNISKNKAVSLGVDYPPLKPGLSCEVDAGTAKLLKGCKQISTKAPED